MIITQNDFTNWCEHQKINDTRKTYMEILVEACDHFGIDYEYVKPLLSQTFILKLEQESKSFNLLKNDTKSFSLKSFL